MTGWTAASLFPSSLLKNAISKSGGVPPPGALSTADKLRLSGGVTRQALAASTTVPAATSANTSAPLATVTPKSTGSALTPATQPAATNLPPALTAAAPENNQQDILDLLSQILGGQQQDPELVHAQTVLAQQQAMQTARSNQEARAAEAKRAAQGYLQSQIQDANQYTTGSVGGILKKRYEDRAKILGSQGELNWLNMPSSSFLVPRRSGWTGPAMPTPGFGF